MPLTTVQYIFTIAGALLGGLSLGFLLGYGIRAGMTSYYVEPVTVNDDSPSHDAPLGIPPHVGYPPSRWLPGYSQDVPISQQEAVLQRDRSYQGAENSPIYLSQERLNNLLEPRDETISRDEIRPRDD